METTSLDKASLLILERIQTMEDNLLQRMENATGCQNTAPMIDKPTATVHRPKTTRLNMWPNGDIIMSWNILKDAVARCGQHRHWELYRHELTSGSDIPGLTPGPSPSIKAEFVSSEIATDAFYSEPIVPDETAASPSAPRSPDITTSLIRNYVVNIHSKSPILDLEFLKKLEEQLLENNQLAVWPVHKELPAGLQPSDMAILLLVLALGEVSPKTSPQSKPLKQSYYITLALPWLGVTAFGNAPPMKDLQAQLLLASYYMWTLKPWRAWSHAETAAAKAETILLRYPGILEQKLSHRVLWAVAKMQLELTEEIYPHLGLMKPGRLGQLIQSTPIPPPPLQPFEWPSIGPQLDTDTWYYYLAETSSRRLVERIKAELYNNENDAVGAVSSITASYRLACEFERQINEWMSSLPEDLRAASQPFESSLATASDLEQSTKQRMRKVLIDRQGQLLMLVFRPFLAALANDNYQPDESINVNESLLKGGAKYVHYAMKFLAQQYEQPVRHYGCWLLARNIWSTVLSLIAACHIPAVVNRMDLGEMASPNTDSIMLDSPMSHGSFASSVYGGPFCQKALEACQEAHRLLRLWDGESPSLSFCSDQLWALIADAQWHIKAY
ncbi:uncharacterized protein B0J16DRAFT_322077 [Fusarium flagelliforme]|uniref:uncharacterized protein n=1 Tax=Fusarium flagelliforme TaxID=2675880 RepID=UPI001E8DC34C|nr:uncharacterized protein B0J16DRAFT_322077 [Fusarium flagelliforme]KAH7183340.1 hypothetical protein B0J16DRAFT_322077 [Fusarium flagelliforme]